MTRDQWCPTSVEFTWQQYWIFRWFRCSLLLSMGHFSVYLISCPAIYSVLSGVHRSILPCPFHLLVIQATLFPSWRTYWQRVAHSLCDALWVVHVFPSCLKEGQLAVCGKRSGDKGFEQMDLPVKWSQSFWPLYALGAPSCSLGNGQCSPRVVI